MAAVGLATLAAVILAALPAAVIAHFLPPQVSAEDLSGTLWHGSAGKVSIEGRDAGAVEWRLRPQALLGLVLSAEIHWVKAGFVADGLVRADRKGFSARAVRGTGPIQDLNDIGLAPGWSGNAEIAFSELESDYAKVSSAVGEIKVADLFSAQVAEGADLGSFELSLAPGAIDAAGNIDAHLNDTGGPLEVQAIIHYSPADRTGLLRGTLRERAGAPAALHAQLDSLAQVRPRDAQGRIQAELEFRL